MFYSKLNKVVLDYQNYNNFLFLKKEKENLVIEGLFGKISINIPTNIFLIIENNKIFLYVNKNNSSKLKFFYNMIIFSCVGVLFNHFINISIMGIGFKFSLENDNLFIHHGNSLPTKFDLPYNVFVLNNESVNNFSILSSDYVLLNNFVSNIQKKSMPNKYKKIGIFLNKKL